MNTDTPIFDEVYNWMRATLQINEDGKEASDQTETEMSAGAPD